MVPLGTLQALASSEAASGVDMLLGGVVEPGALTRVHMAAVDTQKGRLAGQTGFEGLAATTTLQKALEDILDQVRTYWIDLERGESSQLQIVIQGIRSEEEIPRIQEAIQSLPGIRGVRREQTSVENSRARVVFRTFFSGASGVLTARLAELSWESPSGPAGLEPSPQGGYRVRYQ